MGHKPLRSHASQIHEVAGFKGAPIMVNTNRLLRFLNKVGCIVSMQPMSEPRLAAVFCPGNCQASILPSDRPQQGRLRQGASHRPGHLRLRDRMVRGTSPSDCELCGILTPAGIGWPHGQCTFQGCASPGSSPHPQGRSSSKRGANELQQLLRPESWR